jgi:hypothetical protein
MDGRSARKASGMIYLLIAFFLQALSLWFCWYMGVFEHLPL